MKTLIRIQLFLLLFLSTSSIAQVTVTLRNVAPTSGGPTISQCGEINMGSNASITYSCEVYLEKPYQHALGATTLYIYLENSVTGSRNQLDLKSIPSSSFWGGGSAGSSQNFNSHMNFTLNASSINLTGDKVVAVLDSGTGIEYFSCKYPIKRTISTTPVFSLYPTSKTISCGATTTTTFSVNNANNTPGTVTYRWNVGSGWATTAGVPVNGVLTTNTNTLALVPNSYPLSNISVLPILNGVYQSSLQCQVSISPFYSTGGIAGNASLCSGGSVYTMHSLLSNETVTWTVSDPMIAMINNATGNQVTITGIGQGDVLLIGTISNSCNQTVIKKRKIGVGAPIVIAPNCGGLIPTPIDQFPIDNSACDLCRSNYFFADKNMIEAEATGGHNLTWEWEQLSTNFVWTTLQHRARFLPYNLGMISFRVRAGNACGWSAWVPQQINITQNCEDENQDNQNFRIAENSNFNERATGLSYFTAYPNPTTNVINLELINQAHTPNKKAIISAELFDFYGFSKAKINMADYKGQLNVSHFPKGKYILKISVDGKVESHQIVVE